MRHNSELAVICRNLRGGDGTGTQRSKATNSKDMPCKGRTRLKGECCFFSTAVNLQPMELAHTCFRGNAAVSGPYTNTACISCFWLSVFWIGFPTLFLDLPFLFLIEKNPGLYPRSFLTCFCLCNSLPGFSTNGFLWMSKIASSKPDHHSLA